MSECKWIAKITLVLNFSLLCLAAQAQKIIPPPVTNETWSKDYEPFRIAGNLYYVGTYELACYLVTSPQGHILINTGLAESTPLLRAHIEKLGFELSDIKILLTMQAHYDHVAAMAEIKKLTSAKAMINEKDAPVMADGGYSDYFMGGKGKLFEEVKADRLLHDYDTITLGDVKMVMLHHPGHTKGSSSYLLDVKDEHRSYRVLIANMPTVIVDDVHKVAGYPDMAKDYAFTFDAMKKLKFDIWLAAHAGQMGLHEKHKSGDGYHPEAFVGRKDYDSMINELQQAAIRSH